MNNCASANENGFRLLLLAASAEKDESKTIINIYVLRTRYRVCSYIRLISFSEDPVPPPPPAVGVGLVVKREEGD